MDQLVLHQIGGKARVAVSDHRNARGKAGHNPMQRLLGHHEPAGAAIQQVLEVEVVPLPLGIPTSGVMLEAETRSDGQPGRHLPVILEEDPELLRPRAQLPSGHGDPGRAGQAQQDVAVVPAGVVAGEIPATVNVVGGPVAIIQTPDVGEPHLEQVGALGDGDVVLQVNGIGVGPAAVSGGAAPQRIGQTGVEGAADVGEVADGTGRDLRRSREALRNLAFTSAEVDQPLGVDQPQQVASGATALDQVELLVVADREFVDHRRREDVAVQNAPGAGGIVTGTPAIQRPVVPLRLAAVAGVAEVVERNGVGLVDLVVEAVVPVLLVTAVLVYPGSVGRQTGSFRQGQQLGEANPQRMEHVAGNGVVGEGRHGVGIHDHALAVSIPDPREFGDFAQVSRSHQRSGIGEVGVDLQGEPAARLPQEVEEAPVAAIIDLGDPDGPGGFVGPLQVGRLRLGPACQRTVLADQASMPEIVPDLAVELVGSAAPHADDVVGVLELGRRVQGFQMDFLQHFLRKTEGAVGESQNPVLGSRDVVGVGPVNLVPVLNSGGRTHRVDQAGRHVGVIDFLVGSLVGHRGRIGLDSGAFLGHRDGIGQLADLHGDVHPPGRLRVDDHARVLIALEPGGLGGQGVGVRQNAAQLVLPNLVGHRRVGQTLGLVDSCNADADHHGPGRVNDPAAKTGDVLRYRQGGNDQQAQESNQPETPDRFS